MELTPSVRDRLKGARELARAHQATIRAGEAILAALDVLFPDDDDEPVYGEGQLAADLAEAEAHRETAEILSDPDTMAALREAEAETADDAAHRLVLQEVAAERGRQRLDRAEAKAKDDAELLRRLRGEDAEAEAVDYAASSAGRSETPPPPSCWRCEGMDEDEAFEFLLGLCHRHAANEREHARHLSVQVRDLDSTVRAQAVALRKLRLELVESQEAMAAVRAALPDAP